MAGLGSFGPLGTLVAVGAGPTPTPIITQNTNRNGLIFFNSSINTIVLLVPDNLKADPNFTSGKGGIVLLPQGNTGRVLMPQLQPFGFGAAWYGIAVGGSPPAYVLALELYGA